MVVTTPKPAESDHTLAAYRAAVVHAFDAPLSVEEVRAPELEPGQIRV